MGATMSAGLCGGASKTNKAITPGGKKRGVGKPATKAKGELHMLSVALDYEYPNELDACALTASPDAHNFMNLGKLAGAKDVVFLCDNSKVSSQGWPTKDRVAREFSSMASRCKAGDFFVFTFSGHGTQGEDSDGDEEDGMDEEICLFEQDGTYNPMKDDEIAELLAEFSDGVKILVISDCCHSGTICDLDGGELDHLEIIHLAAVTDEQEANDLGAGGAFTMSLIECVEDLVEERAVDPTVADVYNMALKKFNNFDAQTFQWNVTASGDPNTMPWPLWPGADSGFTVNTLLD